MRRWLSFQDLVRCHNEKYILSRTRHTRTYIYETKALGGCKQWGIMPEAYIIVCIQCCAACISGIDLIFERESGLRALHKSNPRKVRSLALFRITNFESLGILRLSAGHYLFHCARKHAHIYLYNTYALGAKINEWRNWIYSSRPRPTSCSIRVYRVCKVKRAHLGCMCAPKGKFYQESCTCICSSTFFSLSSRASMIVLRFFYCYLAVS